MGLQSIVNCSLIALGAIVMVASLVHSRQYGQLVLCIRREARDHFQLFFTLHRALMAFFLLGYLGAIVAIVMHFPLLSESFVSFLFLFGSLFVYLCVTGHVKLLQELESTQTGKKS